MNGSSEYIATNGPEVCFNLWAFADFDTGIVLRISGRPYVLAGTDGDKSAVLRQLAATDFYTAPWVQVPEGMTVPSGDGQRLRGATATLALDHTDAVFGPLLAELEVLPSQLRSVGGQYQQFRFEAGDDYRVLVTIVIEYEDGRLVPQLGRS